MSASWCVRRSAAKASSIRLRVEIAPAGGGAATTETRRISLRPVNSEASPAFLTREPDLSPGLDANDVALAAALSHLAYFDEGETDFVSSRLLAAGFDEITRADFDASDFLSRLSLYAEQVRMLGFDIGSLAEEAQEIETFGNQFYVATRMDSDGPVLYIAIRGTDDALDLLADLACAKSKDGLPRGIRIYTVNAFLILLSEYPEYLTPDTGFFFTGHSVGGAVATVLSVLLERTGIPWSRMNTNDHFRCTEVHRN